VVFAKQGSSGVAARDGPEVGTPLPQRFVYTL